MRRATRFSLKGDWPAESAEGLVTLKYDDRRRRRLRLETDRAEAFLLDLPEAVILPDGAGLQLEDGGWIGVQAAPEPVAKIACEDPGNLVPIAWHLGNRHLPTEITRLALYVRQDHVIEAMVAGLGAQVTRMERSFNPGGGAYGGYPTASHEHHHDHENDHVHRHMKGRRHL